MNETARKFGYPASMVGDYDHWLVLLRPAQVTLGSLESRKQFHECIRRLGGMGLIDENPRGP